MSKKSPPATIVDVANKAGVSTATVSRLLNKGGPVSEAARESIEAAIKELEYTPQRKRKSRLQAPGSGPASTAHARPPLAFVQLGMSPSSAHSQVANQLNEALQQAALAHGRTLVSHRLPGIDPSTDLHDLLGKAEGVILRTISDPAMSQEMIEWFKDWPTVKVLGGSSDHRTYVDHITTDHYQAGMLAAEYLAGKGCTQFIFMTNTLSYDAISDRCVSFVKAAHRMGIPVHVVTRQPHSPHRETELKHLELFATYVQNENPAPFVKTLVDQHPEPTGLFVPTDMQYSMFMPQLQVLGVNLGDTVHAISCDRELRCLEDLEPMQATLDLHISNIAIRAIRRLLFRIEHPNEPLARISVSPDIVLPENVMKVEPTEMLDPVI